MSETLYLAHHGIKGQKWGVRRFQNEDGSVTPAGAERYYVNKGQKKAAYDSAKELYRNEKKRYRSAVARKGYATTAEEKRYASAEREKRYAKEDLQNEKVKERLNKEKKVSKHRQKLIDHYLEKGMSQEEAEIAAYKRARTEKVLAATAAVAVTAIAAYAGYQYYKNNTDKIIEAGTTLARVDSDPTIHDAFYAVRGDNELDKAKYAGYYAQQLMTRDPSWHGKSLSIGVGEGIKMASPNSARKILAKTLNDSEEFRKNLTADLFVLNSGGGTSEQMAVARKAMAALKAGRYDDRSLYEAANLNLANWKSPATKKFYESLRDAGYGAIKDVNDSKLSGFHTKDPLIVFDASKVSVDKVTDLASDQVSKDFVRAAKDIYLNMAIKSAKKPAILAALGITTKEVVKNVVHTKNSDKIVSEYRKEHPDTELSYEEIVRNYERNH